MSAIWSCTPEKRVARLVKKYNLERNDTVWSKDTVISQSVRRDSTFFYNTKDSVIIREGRLVMKYFYNNHDSTVYLRGECLPDTIYRDLPITVNSVNVQESKGFLQGFKEGVLNPTFWLLIIVLIALFLRR